mgnify:CR=1 FL=1
MYSPPYSITRSPSCRARAADAVTSRIGVGVGAVVRMPLGAVRLHGIERGKTNAAQHIEPAGDQFQMIWSDAGSIAAQMIPFVSGSRNACREMVGQHHSVVRPERPVSILSTCRRPAPAGISWRDFRPEPLYGCRLRSHLGIVLSGVRRQAVYAALPPPILTELAGV